MRGRRPRSTRRERRCRGAIIGRIFPSGSGGVKDARVADRWTGQHIGTHVRASSAVEVDYGGRAKDPWGNERAAFAARASLARKDFGLGWNQILEAGGVLVGDRVDVEIEIEAVKQAAAKAA
jgi:hypothetical protein